MSLNPFIRIGEKMKKWLYKIIDRDFGNVSYAKGLYSILCLYEKYVPEGAKRQYRNGKKRLMK